MGTRLDSVDNLKNQLRIPAAETLYDADLGSLVEDISQECSTYCARTFAYTTYANELYHSRWQDVLVLKNYPVDPSAAFTLVIQNGAQLFTVAGSDYVVENAPGIVRMRPGAVFPEEPDAAQVSYSAGYQNNNLSGTAVAVLVPNDLARSVRKLCAAEWKNQQGAIDDDALAKVRKASQEVWAEYARKW